MVKEESTEYDALKKAMESLGINPFKPLDDYTLEIVSEAVECMMSFRCDEEGCTCIELLPHLTYEELQDLVENQEKMVEKGGV